ncbi:ABC transporter ATP-binding protein [Zavarzinia compransoris]|uniref:ABC transporter ATP-binding protein n=1 Tax=Zavarzinia compransoris TaxID=1264899 RepID=A0A317DZF2_9PROT|nr:ABC transporter ATP-binding protein [Zavarzinia compransoris]PWR18265.1 ABC transporter ATP-binding protein [Zavarzinia compransoris]TDP43679.1 oligopeptide/dipeptide ABC transporter ATP-binding protein [Zavarzinia compransoris]
MTAAALDIRGLSVRIGRSTLVDGISLSLAPQETLGIVGESGSGKTLTALAVMGLLPAAVRAEGSIRLGDADLLGLPERGLNRLRGRRIAMVFQDSASSLNPVRTIGAQLAESIRRHQKTSRRAARGIAAEALGAAGIPAPAALLDAYPHQLSGGLRQRAMIALALANDPEVLIADEPTTALDATVQLQVLALLKQHARRAATVLITHDFGVAAEVCDRIAVMYHGRIVEIGPTEAILRRPRHPYAAALVDLVPRLDGPARLIPIPGAPPPADQAIAGCAFAARCGRASAACAAAPLALGAPDHAFACWNPLHA